MASSGKLQRRSPEDICDSSFIDEERIYEALAAGKKYSRAAVREVLAKARQLHGLELEELAALLWLDDQELLEEMFQTARCVKEAVYGKRLVFFAPLYVSDYCVNNCAYCGYRRHNRFPRRKLSMEEVRQEVMAIEQMGHKRIALEAGEDPLNCPIDYIVEAMKTIYETRMRNGSIRRINVNIAATTVAEYKLLKEAGIGTYVLFQETYHRDTYRRLHDGPKADYDWHTSAMDRAFRAGIDDVGLGVLYGLYDWRFDTCALLAHAKHLDSTYGVGPHTVSVPRLRPAAGVSLERFPYLVSDHDFKKTVAAIRLAIPYTGMILSTREEPSFREELVALGISQISAGSCTGVGGYSKYRCVPGSCQKGPVSGPNKLAEESQFEVRDHRTLEQVIMSLLPGGYIPSFCTACYRTGRTGERFMSMAKPGDIHEFCLPNAILTFQEYLRDYASEETRRAGELVISRALQEIDNPAIRAECARRLDRIKNGESDLYL